MEIDNPVYCVNENYKESQKVSSLTLADSMTGVKSSIKL